MKTIYILEGQDQVQDNDWMRPLHIISMSGGRSDYYDFSPTNNNAKWQQVKYCLGKCWHGRTVNEIDAAFDEFNHYEFVRGDVPLSHRESTVGLTDHSKTYRKNEDDAAYEYDDDIPF